MTRSSRCEVRSGDIGGCSWNMAKPPQPARAGACRREPRETTCAAVRLVRRLDGVSDLRPDAHCREVARCQTGAVASGVRILGLDPGSRVCGYGVDRRERRRAALRRVRRADRARDAADGAAARRDRARPARGDRRARARRSSRSRTCSSHQNARSALALAQARGMALAVIGLCRARRSRRTRRRCVKKAVVGLGRGRQGPDRAHGAGADRAAQPAARRRDATRWRWRSPMAASCGRPRCARRRPSRSARGCAAPSGTRRDRAARGHAVERDPPHVVVDCGGVGYEVMCSAYTLAGAAGRRRARHAARVHARDARPRSRCSGSSTRRSARCSIC